MAFFRDGDLLTEYAWMIFAYTKHFTDSIQEFNLTSRDRGNIIDMMPIAVALTKSDFIGVSSAAGALGFILTQLQEDDDS